MAKKVASVQVQNFARAFSQSCRNFFFFRPSHFCCRVHFLSLITRKSFIHLRYLIDTDNIEKFGQEVFFSCQYSFLLSIFPIFTHDTNFLFLLFMLIFLPIWCQFGLRSQINGIVHWTVELINTHMEAAWKRCL